MKTSILSSGFFLNRQYLLLGILITAIMGFTACDSDDVGDNLYTFTDQMLGQYITDPENAEFSEFARLMDTVKVMGLLNAYGQFTAFAPTNEAMQQFYAAKGKTGLADFTLDSLKMIAYDHLVNGDVILYVNFIDGRLPQLTMSERYVSISYSDLGETFVNKNSMVVQKDIIVHNGVIHKINRVLDPTREGIVEVIGKDENFKIFFEALIATGMADSLLRDRDDSYDRNNYDITGVKKEENQWFYNEVPTSRKYGYTVLMESDATFAAAGITNLEELKQYAASVYDAFYPEDATITNIMDRRNSLNRFISYHLINKQLSYAKFIDAYDTDHMLKTSDMFEYIETMLPNTLMEIKKERQSGETNLINAWDPSATVRITSNYDNDATNGVYHEIDKILTYNADVHTYLSTKRLRFDAASFFPELTNNDMRGSRFQQNTTSSMYRDQSLHFQIPPGYIERIQASEQTVVGYLAGYPRFQNYMADEIFLSASGGKLYDFTITTPPIPEGTYEVRFGYLTNGRRGVAQLYLDGVPAGVPLNLNNGANHVSIGYETPGSVTDDPFGFENDKMMRNRGFMKGPASFKVAEAGWTNGENARYSNANLRKIMGTYDFREAGHHTLMVKGLSGGEFMFDYLEFVPTSVIEYEDIY